MSKNKLIPLIDYVLEIDFLTTNEFCEKYSVPLPYFTGEVKSSADKFLQIDAIKHRMFVEYAKLLNNRLTTLHFTKLLGFDTLETRGGFPRYEQGKYIVVNDQYGFFVEMYDAVDGFRVQKLRDLADLGLLYNGS